MVEFFRKSANRGVKMARVNSIRNTKSYQFDLLLYAAEAAVMSTCLN